MHSTSLAILNLKESFLKKQVSFLQTLQDVSLDRPSPAILVAW